MNPNANPNATTTLYYSPRFLPDDDLDNENDSKEEKENKYIQRFIHAIVREEKSMFDDLLPKIDINYGAEKKKKWTPLLWAIQKDRTVFIEAMFAKPDQIIDFHKHIDQKTLRTVLHFAADKGDEHLLQLMLDKNHSQQQQLNDSSIALDIDAVDKEGATAIFRAAKIGDTNLVRILIKFGADPNIPNRDGITPLIIATHRGYGDTVKLLIECKNIDINMKDERGRTALMCSCAENRISIAKMLMECDKIEMDAVDKQNFNWNCLMWCVYRKNEKMLNILITKDTECKFDYFGCDLYGKNALEMAISKRLSKECVKELREKYYSILLPELIESELVVMLKVPAAVLSALLVFTY